MKTKKPTNRKKRTNLLSKVCLTGFAAYLLVSLVMTQVDIVTKKQELAALENQIEQQEIANMELERLVYSEGGLDYIERIARDRFNYALPGEKVFVDISGQ